MNKQENMHLPNVSDQQRTGRYLLVVDSDMDNLIYTSMLLQKFSYHPHIAKTAKEAFLAVNTAKPALIIATLDLVDLNGLDLIRLLRKNLGTIEIPCIILKKTADSTSENQCFDAGAVDCLTKPVSAEKLYHAVRNALSTAETREIYSHKEKISALKNNPKHNN
jgi:two-component system, OmpR family, KDP operon response regulator KdpE